MRVPHGLSFRSVALFHKPVPQQVKIGSARGEKTTLHGTPWQSAAVQEAGSRRAGPFIGRNEYRESLQTSDIEVARTRAALKGAAVTIEFEQARAMFRQAEAAKPQMNLFSAHSTRIGALLKKLGLDTRLPRPGELVTGAYTLRKTFITQCGNQGVVSKGDHGA